MEMYDKEENRERNHNEGLNRYRYDGFGEAAKILLTFITYYAGKYERAGNTIGFTCPNCDKTAYSRCQLSSKRKTL